MVDVQDERTGSRDGADRTEPHPLSNIDQLIHAPARLMLLTYLYVVESADFVFLKRMTGLSWGNLSTHLSKLEEAGYVALDKEFRGKKPHTMVSLTEHGRTAFSEYRSRMQEILDGLPG
ncbi:MAG: transcriptional regulator [Candidatus Eiseniibacteriota bacterium]|nr:MAG: transcriptional regulator [Candidatus Eisenbacteria bacterium]